MSHPEPPSNPNEMTTAALEVDALRGLVSAAQNGSRPAADELVRAHDGWIRSVIYAVTGKPVLVDDIAQQVWTQVWERLPSLKEPERVRSWLYAIARNAAIDWGQAYKRRAGVALDDVPEASDGERSLDPVASTAGAELRTILLRAVEALPALYREPFVMRHLEGWSYQEIGATLGLPLETVETRLVRARRLLKEMLKGKVDV